MTEQEIRAIVRDEMNKNYADGSPDIPPHSHNGTDGLNVNPIDLVGASPIPTGIQLYVNEDSGLNEYGFGAVQSLAPGDGTHLAQRVTNTTIAMYPIPVVVGNGVGTQGAFDGGWAPDGTMVLFETGTFSTTFLYIRSRGIWYGFLANSQL